MIRWAELYYLSSFTTLVSAASNLKQYNKFNTQILTLTQLILVLIYTTKTDPPFPSNSTKPSTHVRLKSTCLKTGLVRSCPRKTRP